MICNATESNASDKFLKKMSTKMSVLAIDPVYHRYVHRYSLKPVPNFQLISKKSPPFHIISTQTPINGATTSSRDFRAPEAVVETSESSKTTFNETFELERTEKVEGKIITKFERGKNDEHWWLTVGCSIPGTWILHWGVNYAADVGWEWDQPPLDMRPPGSIAIKDYAIETPFKRKSASVEGEEFYEVVIEFNTKSSIAAINFVLKDDETGNWYQHRGRDFKLSLIEYLQDDGNVVGAKKDSSIWPGGFGQLSEIFIKPEASESKVDIEELSLQKKPLEGFYEEHSVVKVTAFHNSVSVSVKHFHEQAKNVLHVETDLPGDVVVHWGVCRDENKNWEIPSKPYPPQTTLFKNKALRTLLKQKNDGNGSWGSFSLADERFLAFLFVLKLDNTTWINYKGNDFYIPFSCPIVPEKRNSESCDGILKGIRSLASDISSEKSRKTQSKEAHRSILHEIERLAAEAYSIFRSSLPTFLSETEMPENESSVKISSGTGSGFEILCQGFNWESHKSGKWYMELHEKAPKLAELGFTVIWLPPPTDSVSPEGYMPRDLYNLNSRYGNMDQLKNLVKRLHEVNIRVLGDVVLNHRCAQHRNQNGIWNIFGGRLNWDDRAVVSDDPHFQGRGNKSSGDNFHAAPNIDHSQEFVRKDIREWLCWLRDEIGYDGWRLDFARGFWGGYVKDYLDSSEPYFAVGEFWDSLSYRYGEMEHDQDAHRQRIVDWINATNGTAGAFDVTTKGILHSALERCEYWRLSDNKEKPPGVLGWWPSRAVTFIENHDTGSTQGHWRFPSGKEMQGYAYILTHAGTPSVFYDHIFSEYQSEISALISIRKKNKIHCRSKVQIIKAEGDVYAALIDENLTMKIGPGHFEPSNDARNWSLAIEGEDYKVWQAS